MRIGGLEIPMLDRVPRATWSIGRRTKTAYFTVHYNGPAVKGFGNPRIEQEQIRSDARWHMRPGALGSKRGGDGVQYHGGTLSDGSNWLFRDIFDLLWHCANKTGNERSISWHLPLGGDQKPTTKQIQGLYAAIEAFRRAFFISALNVKGHLEWSQTACPGNNIFPLIQAYRNANNAVPSIWYKTRVNANIRALPDTDSAILGIVPANTIFPVTHIIENGKPYQGNPTYVERANGGYHHMSTVVFHANEF